MPEDVYIQFKDFKGECMDEDHPGDSGWIQIKNFSFAFGLEGQATSLGGVDKKKLKGAGLSDAHVEALSKLQEQKDSHDKKKKGWGKSGALKFEPFNFNKGSDIMSKDLMEICHRGGHIPEVKVVMCRPEGQTGKKMEFLTLTFSDVYLKSCDLALVNDELPTESVHFEYNKIQMRAVWTDNATGAERSEAMMAEWDLTKGDGDSQEE